MFQLGQIRLSLKPQNIIFGRENEHISSHLLTEYWGQEPPSFLALLGESSLRLK